MSQDKKFDPFEKPDLQGKRFATVICDTATLARLSGREFYEASVASIVIDHHASNEGYGDRNYTKVSEACAVNVFYSLNQDDLKKRQRQKNIQTLQIISILELYMIRMLFKEQMKVS